MIREYLEHRSETQAVLSDLCYVYNFANARQPLPLELPAGQAIRFQNDMNALVEELKTEIPKAFESEEYTGHRDQALQNMEIERPEIVAHIDQRAAQDGFQLLKRPGGTNKVIVKLPIRYRMSTISRLLVRSMQHTV